MYEWLLDQRRPVRGDGVPRLQTSVSLYYNNRGLTVAIAVDSTLDQHHLLTQYAQTCSDHIPCTCSLAQDSDSFTHLKRSVFKTVLGRDLQIASALVPPKSRSTHHTSASSSYISIVQSGIQSPHRSNSSLTASRLLSVETTCFGRIGKGLSGGCRDSLDFSKGT